MPMFIVERPEVWYQLVRVEAESKEAALRIADKGGGVNIDLEYSHVIGDPENWKITEDGVDDDL